MNRLSEEQILEKKNFAKELDLYLRENYGDPNNEKDSFYMSEAKLAQALKEFGIDIGQKSINRYRNAECLAPRNVQAGIREVFRRLKHKYDREDERDPEEEDFMDAYFYEEDPYYDDGTTFDSEEYSVDAYGESGVLRNHPDTDEEFTKLLDSMVVENPLENIRSIDLGKLDYYSKDAVKYIVDSLELFLYLENTDVKFIRAVNMLPMDKREELFQKLSCLSETKAYINLCGFTEECMHKEEGTVSRSKIHYAGSHTYVEEVYRKLELLKRQMRSCKNLPGRIYEKVQISTHRPVRKCPEELKKAFYESYRKVYGELASHKDELVNNPWAKTPPINERKDFFLFVNELLTFSSMDWYHLYLFVRLQLMEVSEQNLRGDVKLIEIFEGYHVQEKEAMLWRYLQMHEAL